MTQTHTHQPTPGTAAQQVSTCTCGRAITQMPGVALWIDSDGQTGATDRIAAMEAELAALQAATPAVPTVFAEPVTAGQHETAARKDQPRSARRGASPIKTR